MDQHYAFTAPHVGHPFRRQMPPVRIEIAPSADDHDLKLFVLSFTAFFICFYTFIM